MTKTILAALAAAALLITVPARAEEGAADKTESAAKATKKSKGDQKDQKDQKDKSDKTGKDDKSASW